MRSALSRRAVMRARLPGCHADEMLLNVWLPEWEMVHWEQAFAVGDFVQWPAVVLAGTEWSDSLERLFAAKRVTVHHAYAEQAADDAFTVEQVSGRVERISAVAADLVRTPISPRADSLSTADGSASLRTVQRASNRWSSRPPLGQEWVGYLVSLDCGQPGSPKPHNR